MSESCRNNYFNSFLVENMHQVQKRQAVFQGIQNSAYGATGNWMYLRKVTCPGQKSLKMGKSCGKVGAMFMLF